MVAFDDRTKMSWRAQKKNQNKRDETKLKFVFPLQWHVNIFRTQPNDIISVKCQKISSFICYGNLSYVAIESLPTQLV